MAQMEAVDAPLMPKEGGFKTETVVDLVMLLAQPFRSMPVTVRVKPVAGHPAGGLVQVT